MFKKVYMEAYLCFLFGKTLIFLVNKSLLVGQVLLAFDRKILVTIT